MAPNDFTGPALDGGLSLPPVEPGFSPSLPESEQGFTATAPVAQQQNPPLEASPVAAVEDHKGLAVVVLLLCGGALLWSAQTGTTVAPVSAAISRHACTSRSSRRAETNTSTPSRPLSQPTTA